MKFHLQSHIILIGIVFALSSQAIEVKSKLVPLRQSETTKEFIRPKLPEGSPPGGRRTGGGRRDTCLNITPKLTALVPETQETATVTNVWALTTEERPTFWYYVPYTKNSGYPAEFVLQNDKSVPIYTKQVSLPQQAGIISIKIPANEPALELNKQYRWFFKVYCDQNRQAPPMYVEGVINRVKLAADANQKLQTASALQRFAIYAENGIWHQALSTLIELKQQNPQDNAIKTNWSNLLTDIGLPEIVGMQIIPDDSNHYNRLSKQH
jgi:Domain of Unknown Function (DUF928)